jgi:hypothetical protein
VTIHPIQLQDLIFGRTTVDVRSTRGVPQSRLVRVGMPRIPQQVINGVFYLYSSKEDALVGKDPGGTGFIIHLGGGFDSSFPDPIFYGVTNWHVACDRGFSTIRLNTVDGGVDVIDLGPEEWHFIPGKYDIAVVPLSLDGALHTASSTAIHQFSAKPRPQHDSERIGVGDDVFMIGLFVDHAGLTTNVPSARFGNISMLPDKRAAIRQPTGYLGKSYVVDMHSRSGFSGSPVYVYRTFGSDLGDRFWGDEFENLQIDNWNEVYQHNAPMRGRIQSRTLFKLLGIHWGQFAEKWQLTEGAKTAESRSLVVEGGYVAGLSGMTCVIPAWHIMEVLDIPELVTLRKAQAKENPMFSTPKAE